MKKIIGDTKSPIRMIFLREMRILGTCPKEISGLGEMKNGA
jgi:hypothetical protein